MLRNAYDAEIHVKLPSIHGINNLLYSKSNITLPLGNDTILTDISFTMFMEEFSVVVTSYLCALIGIGIILGTLIKYYNIIPSITEITPSPNAVIKKPSVTKQSQLPPCTYLNSMENGENNVLRVRSSTNIKSMSSTDSTPFTVILE